MEAISDLPMLHDIDADYSPQYVKLARIIRHKIKAAPAAPLARRQRRRSALAARAAHAGPPPLEPA